MDLSHSLGPLALPLSGAGAEVRSEGNRIILNFPTLQAAMVLLQPWTDKVKRLELTEHIHQALLAAGLILEVRVKGISMACLGAGAKTGAILQLLGMGPLSR